MYSNKPILFKEERRIKADILSTWLKISAIVVWVALFVAIILWQNASPQAETLLDRLFSVERSSVWDFGLLNIVFYFLVFMFVFSAVSIILNFKRLKRSTDRIRLSFILSIFASAIGILVYLFAVIL